MIKIMENITDEQHDKILQDLWKQNKKNEAYKFFNFFVVLLALILTISFIGAFMSMIIKILT